MTDRWNDNAEDAPVGRIVDVPSFQAAADAYGGDLALWPAARQAEAAALLSRKDEAAAAARAALDRAVRLDALLDRAASKSAPASDGLVALLMRDADSFLAEEQPEARAAPAAARESGRAAAPGLMTRALTTLRRGARAVGEDLGVGPSVGFGALGGLGVAAAAGLAIGMFAPLTGSGAPEPAQILEPFEVDGGLDLFSLAPEDFGSSELEG